MHLYEKHSAKTAVFHALVSRLFTRAQFVMPKHGCRAVDRLTVPVLHRVHHLNVQDFECKDVKNQRRLAKHVSS